MTAPRTLLAAALVVLTLPLAAGCGREEGAEPEPRTEAQSVTVDGLRYRAVLFRELNPLTHPDAALVERRVAAGDALPFAAFVQVCNTSDRARRAPAGFTLVDAFGQTYRPRQDALDDDLAYRARTLAPGECIPREGSVPDRAFPGAAVLFALPRSALADRPLQLVLPPEAGKGGEPPRIRLDL
jgi:hypothetical protein